MEVDKVANMLAHMVAYMEVDRVADMVADMVAGKKEEQNWPTFCWTRWPTC